MSYKKIETTRDVWHAIMAAHHGALVLFETYSDPCDIHGTGRGTMETTWGLPGSDYPLMKARSTFDVLTHGGGGPYSAFGIRAGNEEHKYWLCVPVKEADD